jgi:hypothetical protein
VSKLSVSTGLLTLIVALMPAAVAQAPANPVCPLSEEQTHKSVDAFAKLAKFLTSEPRCVNCHGAVNPYIDGTGTDPEDANAPPSTVEHAGGKMAHEKDSAKAFVVDAGCAGCHSHMAPRADGSSSVWMTAPNFLSFVGKDAPSLCTQIKNASKNAKHFMRHLTDDNGGNNFTATAYNGDRGLDRSMYPESEVPTQKPSIPHAAVMRMGQDWIDAMGGEFKGDRECGCIPSTYSLRFSAETVIRDEDTQYESVMEPLDIPISFEDDGAFHGQATAKFVGAGAAGDCSVQTAANRNFSVAGTATETENEHSMEVALKVESPLNASGAYQCPDQSGGVTKSIWGNGEWPFHLRGEVGEMLEMRMPSPGAEITNTGRVEVVRRDPAQTGSSASTDDR